MSDILFIKTSSLGDVIHHMPALTEARRRLPDARFAWVVEEAFAPLVGLHPAVSEVIPVASRRWRGALHSPSTWRELAAFSRAIRSRRYDEIVDTQGLLLKSALIARRAVARKADPADKRSALFAITAQGRRLHDAILPLRQANQDGLAACLTREERVVLLGALDKLIACAVSQSRRKPGISNEKSEKER